jgi:hypothetical protein
MRTSLAQAWQANCTNEIEMSWKVLSEKSTVAALEKVLERLSGGGKPKAKL